MDGPRFRSLSDVARHRANLRCICRHCARSAVLPGAELHDYFRLRRWRCDLEDVGTRLCCSSCRRRRPAVDPSRLPVDCAWRWPTREEHWRALAKRLRD